jgi:predicted Fe-Mo cluster-binding NifX family protein
MRLKIAVPTKDNKGLEDVVSEVFAKAKTFTIVESEDGEIKNVRVIDNPAASYEYGSGPIVAKMLADLKVECVLVAEIGPGASELLEYHQIRKVLVKPNMKVSDAIREMLEGK